MFPEVFGPQVSTFAPGARKVVFNQNCYRTFTLYGLDKDRSAPSYLDSDVQAVIVASSYAEEYLRHAFPSKRLFRISLGIDATLFSHQPVKKRSLAFMPRRLPEDLGQVINILRFRGVLDDVELVPIDKMSERQVAAALRESLVFLSFSSREGFGLPPAEAMACGCIAIGYAGGGGAEYLLPELSTPCLTAISWPLPGQSNRCSPSTREIPGVSPKRPGGRRHSFSTSIRWRGRSRPASRHGRLSQGSHEATGKPIGRAAEGLVWESQAPIKWQVRTEK